MRTLFSKRSFIPLLLGAGLLACALTSTSALAGKKAFVVGIDDYQNIQQLKLAVNDASAVASKLTELGFDSVLIRKNVTRSQFNSAWQDFLDNVDTDDMVAVYFSGHGVEIEGLNYLMPSDVPYIQYGRESHLKRESISVNEMLIDIRHRSPKLSLLILDACRDNPFVPPEYRTRGVGTTRGGLARIAEGDAAGTFVMYSAGAQQTALENLGAGDDNQHSVYTRLLLPQLSVAGQSIEQLANKLQSQVARLALTADHNQRPAYYDNVINDFCLVSCAGDNAAPQYESTAEPSALETAAGKEETQDLQPVPGGDTAVELAYWNAVEGSNDKVLYQSYLNEYPDGKFSEIAKIKLHKLEQSRPAPTPVPTSVNVEALLTRCRTHLQANRLTTGIGGTALECYREVLEKDPGNTDAYKGLAAVEEKYEKWAESAIRANRLDKAKRYLAGLKIVNPGGDAVMSLEADIEKIETASISTETRRSMEAENVPETVRQLAFTNGDRYEGDTKNDKPHGHGTYVWVDGSRYVGGWKDGEKSGRGTFYLADNRRYEGTWANNKLHGWGGYYTADGPVYEGGYKDGKLHGQGTYYFTTGNCEGHYLNNLAVDVVCRYADGTTSRERQQPDGTWAKFASTPPQTPVNPRTLLGEWRGQGVESSLGFTAKANVVFKIQNSRIDIHYDFVLLGTKYECNGVIETDKPLTSATIGETLKLKIDFKSPCLNAKARISWSDSNRIDYSFHKLLVKYHWGELKRFN